MFKRILFYILMFESLLTNVFSQNPQQMFHALNQNTLPLNQKAQLPAFFAAYSVRKLSSSYNGPAMEVRRSSDNAQADVYFYGGSCVAAQSQVKITAKGTSSYTVGDIVTFSTFYSGTNVYVRTWYDQSGNAQNASQTTSSNQPQIVSSGTLITQKGRPFITFKGLHTAIRLLVSPSASLADGSLFGVYKVDVPSNTLGLADNGTYSYNVNTYNTTGKLGVTRYTFSDNASTISNAGTSTPGLVAWSIKSGNNIEIDTPTTSATVSVSFNLGIAQIYGNSSTSSQLEIAEIFIVNYATSAQRKIIFNNQKGFFGL